MIIITMQHLHHEVYRCTTTWNGTEWYAENDSGAVVALVRKLVTAGCPDQPWQSLRDGSRSMFGPSLHRLAQLRPIKEKSDIP